MLLYNIINYYIKYKQIQKYPKQHKKCGDKRTRPCSNELSSSSWTRIAETWKEGRWNATQIEDSQMNWSFFLS